MTSTGRFSALVLALALSLIWFGFAASGGAVAADDTADSTLPGTIGGAAGPAVNETFLARAGDLSSRLIGEAKGGLANAKAAGGTNGSPTIVAAQAVIDQAGGLRSDIEALRAGKPIKSNGVFAALTIGAGGSGFTDAFKGLPMAPVMQSVLGNLDLVKAILTGSPVDQVPAYATAIDALKQEGL